MNIRNLSKKQILITIITAVIAVVLIVLILLFKNIYYISSNDSFYYEENVNFERNYTTETLCPEPNGCATLLVDFKNTGDNAVMVTFMRCELFRTYNQCAFSVMPGEEVCKDYNANRADRHKYKVRIESDSMGGDTVKGKLVVRQMS